MEQDKLGDRSNTGFGNPADNKQEIEKQSMKNHAKIIPCVLALASFQVYGSPNLVQNGGFETTPYGADWTVTLAPAIPATGTGSHFNFGGVIPPGTDPGGNSPNSGVSSANFGANTPGTGLSVDDVITQTVPTTGGDEYQVSYYLRTAGETGHIGVSGYAQFVSSFGGQTLQNLHDPDPTFGYTEFTYEVEATSSSSVLSFAGQCVNGWFNLDDVSVTDLGNGSTGVPDTASTFGLLSVTLAGLAGLRRKLA